ncbi:type II toxin-antitoxin system PemK/MazF family toxin [Sulfurovum sp. bin170]|uniref:type II toxin-antitoxin system PemK/MazF family toxin n=1 Tax=Sulfurovum sp. bin170 TaxID=2695268 RepID=UPI0013E070A2|nr:type II toxin-antitoxin system PemK/MazF family toxin [Sulfurovum sp. bin170]NEW60897.1 type II toxin-antitoxin system PemK/MazF family toxin [Sulfurovum sp. bin170]
MMELNRGDICLVNFNPAKGGEIGKLRPAIVLSDQEENEILNTVIVIPLSTVIEKDALPYRFLITSRDKLERDCDACIYEIRALSKTRVKEKLSVLSSEELGIIQDSLCKIIK